MAKVVYLNYVAERREMSAMAYIDSLPTQGLWIGVDCVRNIR